MKHLVPVLLLLFLTIANASADGFFVYGVQGIVFALGAIACILVLSHKKAWYAAHSVTDRPAS